MHLTPREIEKLMLHNAGFVAQKRLARGTRLAPLALALAGLALLQVGVGAANVLGGIPVEVTGLHSFLATALVLVATAAWRILATAAPRDPPPR